MGSQNIPGALSNGFQKRLTHLHSLTRICEECNDDLFAVNSSSVQGRYTFVNHTKKKNIQPKFLNFTEYEALLEKISPKLASTHYIVLTVKKYLGDLYGFVKGYRYPELPEEKLLAKIKYLREFVDTISKADPVSCIR